MNEALRALASHHRRCLWCRYLYGCRTSDRLLTAYHRASQADLEAHGAEIPGVRESPS